MKNEMRWIAIYSLYSFINNIVLETTSNEISAFCYYIFTILEYTLFTWLFYNMISKRNGKRVVLIGSFAFVGMVCFSVLNFGHALFDTLNSATEAVLIVIYSVIFFMEKASLMDIDQPPLYEKADFWIVIGCFIYLSGVLFLFLTSGIKERNVWIINSIFNVVRNIFFAIAIHKATRAAREVKRQESSFGEALNW